MKEFFVLALIVVLGFFAWDGVKQAFANHGIVGVQSPVVSNGRTPLFGN